MGEGMALFKEVVGGCVRVGLVGHLRSVAGFRNGEKVLLFDVIYFFARLQVVDSHRKVGSTGQLNQALFLRFLSLFRLSC